MFLDVCTIMNVSMLKPLSRVVNSGDWDVFYGLLTILTVIVPSLDRRRALVRRGSGPSLLMPTASQKRVRVLQRPPGSAAKAAPKPATRSLPRPERRAQLAAVRVLPRVPGAVSVRANRAAVLRERLARRKYTASLGLEAKRSRDTSDEPADTDDLGSDEDDLERAPTSRRDQAILARAKKRARLYAHLEETGEDSSLLEELAVRPGTGTAASYAFFLDALMVAFPGRSISGLSDASIDEHLVGRLNFQFKIGMDLSSGEKTMAAFRNKFVDFTKFGKRRVPRAWKCLIAWRKRSPTRSRNPKSWHVIAALIVRLVARGHFHMGVFVALMWATWCRPSELMTLRRKDLIPVMPGVSRFWCVNVAPSGLDLLTKTGEEDVSIEVDAPETRFLDKILPILKEGDEDAGVWHFDYPTLAREVRAIATTEFAIDDLVVYSIRHSAASWSILRHKWGVPKAIKKGRWATLSSLNRYAKAAKVAQEYQSYSVQRRRFYELSDRLVRGVMLCEVLPPRLPW